MKAIPKVNIDGLYLEDELVDDAFSGVVPFYAEPEPIVFDPEASEQPVEPDVPEEDEDEVEREIAGYIVGVPVPAGLFRPRFDLAAWEAYQDADPQESFPELWIEGLSQEEIDELTKPQPTEPTELDRFGEQLVQRELEALELKQQNEILGQQIVMRELEGADLKAQNEALGGQIVGLELRVLTVETQSKGDEANV
ncbi:hypothetical protein [Paenibacillus amylolyticus]|uniref:Bacteriophage SP-beta YorD domain-containing protein n=1 Tax=Paenibacillus amylolyticus TaxID=1451 RepID=A0A124DXW7_PAEAM|nr:hypothetical protein [Paenibacillus amylolyticus]GAS82384.1 unknown protein [Paenibacillus amylolyticus]